MTRSISAALLTLAIAAPLAAQKPKEPTAAAPKTTAANPAPKAPAATTAKPTAMKNEAAEQKKLQAEAKVSESAARATALSKVAKGATVVSEELEREGGKLIYSYDLKVPGKSGVDEVHIDAITGAQVGKTEHESAKAEAAEAKKEAKKDAPKPPVKKSGK
jgi:uncharacterized membrane protein YkoI